MQAVQSRLSAYQHALSRWSWRKFGNGEEQLRMKTKQLVDLQKNESPDNIETIKCLQAEIDGIIEREDIKWKQRAKQNLYQKGYRNTQFFHSWANHRRKINSI